MLYFCEACYAYNKIWGMFKDRNDPAAWDWVIGDLVVGGAWHDLDLSAIVPENAKAVLIRLRYRGAIIGVESNLRANGKANAFNVVRFDSQIANLAEEYNVVVQCDPNRLIEYHIGVPAIDRFQIVIMGWWF